MCNTCINEELLHNEEIKGYINIQTGEILDLEKVYTLPDNAMLKVKPDLWIEWDFEKNNELGLDIWKVTKGSNKKAWWVCKKCNSTWEAMITNRQNQNCPYCRGLKVNETNSLEKLRPDLSSEWNYHKNKLTPSDYVCGSNKKVWWICDKGHEWEAIINNRHSKHHGCPVCAGIRIVKGYNDISTTDPELIKFWNFDRNHDTCIFNVGSGFTKKIWWKCPCCNSEFEMKIFIMLRLNNCPYCSGYRVNHTNSLATINPELAAQWHPTLNGELSPNDITSKSNKKAWWIGNCGHEWESVIITRANGVGCPYCASNPKVLKGFNDMWTTNPELASLLANPEDGYKYTQSSNKKADWRCPNCEDIIKNKVIGNINIRGLSCHRCNDGVSFPEKLMYLVLKELNIQFELQKKFKWSDNRIYDFYISSMNLIIETHGTQHYTKNGFHTLGGRTLEEEQANDKYKYDMAIVNGINEYIVIDCRYSDFGFIKNNILNSRLAELFDLSKVDWCQLNKIIKYQVNQE